MLLSGKLGMGQECRTQVLEVGVQLSRVKGVSHPQHILTLGRVGLLTVSGSDLFSRQDPIALPE